MKHNALTNIEKELKPGYKKTKLGWIPEEWELKKLEEIGSFKNGINKSKNDFGKGHPFVNLVDVFGQSTVNIDSLGLVKVKESELKSFNLKKGDVLFIRSSVKPSGVGLTALVDDDIKDTTYSGFLIRFRDDGQLNHLYKKYCFDEPRFRHRLMSKSTISANTNINQQSLNSLLIPLPPLPEQKKIADILSAWDRAIEILEQLITKKEELKKGLMQQLLTGKKRFPGFEGEWKTIQISQIGSVSLGGTPSTSKKEFWDGNIKWCTPTDITALNGRKYISETERQITEKGLNSSSAKLLKPDSIIVCTRATIGDLAIAKVPIATNQGFKNLTIDSKKADVEFIYYLLLTKKKELIRKSSGSTFLELSSKDFKKIRLELPSLEEQKKIADMFSKIDSEIEAIRVQKEFFVTQKKGLMQQLLTGKLTVNTKEDK